MEDTEIRTRSRAIPVTRIRVRQRPAHSDPSLRERYGDLTLPLWDIWSRNRMFSGLFMGDRMTHGASVEEATETFHRANADYEIAEISSME